MVEVVDPSDQHVDAGLHVSLCDVVLGDLLASAIQENLQALDLFGITSQHPAYKAECCSEAEVPEHLGRHQVTKAFRSG